MKSIIYFILSAMILTFSLNSNVIAQTDSTHTDMSKIYIITTYQGGEFVGKIISQDAKEVLIETKDKGQVLIPKYEIKEMKEIQVEEFTKNGDYIPKQVFSTRYFLTTNGLPIEKGESYLQWNLYGPDFEFGVGKNFGLGIMTSWIGMPIIGTAKYSIPLSKKANLAIGTLLGTGSWTAPDFGIALPFTALTLGDRRSNINFSFGYGAVFSDGQSDGRVLMSV